MDWNTLEEQGKLAWKHFAAQYPEILKFTLEEIADTMSAIVDINSMVRNPKTPLDITVILSLLKKSRRSFRFPGLNEAWNQM